MNLKLQNIIKKLGNGGTTKALDKDRNITKYTIRDLDVLTNECDVVTKLREKAINDIERLSVKLISLRKAQRDTQIALVTLNKDLTEIIIKDGMLNIGLVKVKLKEWIEVSRCYRCWESGHLAKTCKREGRSGACLKCGKKDGHNAKQCSNEEFCPLCQRPGHRAGSGICLKMRAMITKIKRQKEDGKKKLSLR